MTNANVAVFRRMIRARKDVKRAEWNLSALGALEARVNGNVVSHFLDPGFSQPEKTRFAMVYDITSSMHRGDNMLEVSVAPTWWRCRMTRRAYPKAGASLPRNAAIRAKVHLDYVDGTSDEFVTDGSWLSAYTGPILDAGVFDGERVDARRGVEGLAPAIPSNDFKGEVGRRQRMPVLLREDLVLRPKVAYVWKGTSGATDDAYGKVVVARRYETWSVVDLAPGETLVVDFAQNAAAIPRFELDGPSGAEMTVRMGEVLNDANGEKSQRCDGPAGSVMLANLRTAEASIRYVFRDGMQTYRPTFTFFGYRYLSITATKPVRIVSVESVPVTSVSKESESPVIVTGNARINRLAENIRWGFRSNYLEVPTDCPQRDERLGWTADTLAFVSAAEYSADVSGFLGKWLGDLRDCQGTNGAFPTLAPLVWAAFGEGAVAGWSDAGILVPYRLWKRYGKREILDAHWDAMERYMSFIAAHHGPDKHYYGDWQAFEHAIVGDGPYLRSPEWYRECFGSFFFVWDALAMKEMAHDLGKCDEECRYAQLEAQARAEFAKRYIGADGLMLEKYRGQTTDLFLLKLGLVKGPAAVMTKEHLLTDIRRHGDCLQTGFLGTMILMDTLTDIGATDVAYTLLLQEKCPSWLFSVNNGATTIWERWDCYDPEKGFQDPGMNSFNHYAYGAVYSWMMSVMAGIREDPVSPGMKHFVLEPVPDRRIGFVKASYNAPCGHIDSAWEWRGDACVWKFCIPKGTSATVRFRNLPQREFSSGTYVLEATNR